MKNQARRAPSSSLRAPASPEPEPRVEAYPHELSGGQRQRAMIAMALACKAAPADRRRADDRARRDHPGADPGAARRAAARDGQMAAVHHARPEPGAPLHAPRGRDGARRLVEEGADGEVFAHPQHEPYTRKLIASRPAACRRCPPTRRRCSRAGRERRTGGGWFARDVRTRCDATLRTASAARRSGIVGESGSGKTTLGWRCSRCRTSPAAASTHRRRAHRQRRPRTLRAMRRRMQVVFQDPFASLSPRMTVGRSSARAWRCIQPELAKKEREQRIPRDAGRSGADAAHGMADVLSAIRTSSPAASGSGSPSRARGAAAGGSWSDEPTLGALDVSVQQEVLALFAQLQQRYGMSYGSSSATTRRWCAMSHRVLVMKDGVTAERGEAQALFEAPRQRAPVRCSRVQPPIRPRRASPVSAGFRPGPAPRFARAGA